MSDCKHISSPGIIISPSVCSGNRNEMVLVVGLRFGNTTNVKIMSRVLHLKVLRVVNAIFNIHLIYVIILYLWNLTIMNEY